MKPKKLGTVTTVDMNTGEIIEVKPNAMTLLPPAGDVCQECAVAHGPFDPHNQQSLYYQMSYFATHGRYPTWSDALAHCPDDAKAAWRECIVDEMVASGMPIPDDLRDEPGKGGCR